MRSCDSSRICEITLVKSRLTHHYYEHAPLLLMHFAVRGTGRSIVPIEAPEFSLLAAGFVAQIGEMPKVMMIQCEVIKSLLQVYLLPCIAGRYADVLLKVGDLIEVVLSLGSKRRNVPFALDIQLL